MPVSQFIEQSDKTDSILDDEIFNPYMDQVLRDFSDILFVNSGCKCQGNNGCTRGCRLESDLDKTQSPPIRKCKDKKSIFHSSANCARHTIGAIMTVIHELLLDYCKNTMGKIFENVKDYQQCVDNFREDIRNNNTNICQHGFRFRYALCMLNLNRQSAHLYNSISDNHIKSECKRWDRYNQSLLTLNIPLYNGKMMPIPLFRKISPKYNKEFQKDTSTIPKGAIIITKSGEYGHVEVKTDRNECGKDKNQTCFCSDYCRERLRYTYPILAVFEWNPEFIEYANINNYYMDFL